MKKIISLLPLASIIFILWFSLTVTTVFFSRLFSNKSGKLFFNAIQLNVNNGVIDIEILPSLIYIIFIGYLLNLIIIFVLHTLLTKKSK